MGCFSGRLMSAASDQKLFCKLCSPFCCSFNEFVEEKVISPSYSSAILTPPPQHLFLKRKEYQTTLPDSWETCMQVKEQQLEHYVEQLSGSKLGKEYIKAIYGHSAHLPYIQSTSFKMLGWINHKLESRLPGEISTTSAMQMIPLPLGRKWRGTTSLLMRVKEESEKAGYKLTH